MTILPYLRLVRFPLVSTAIGDVWAGYFVGLPPSESADPWLAARLGLVSALFYMAGMALNDLADRERDAALHPDRPLPKGEVTVPAAALLVVALFAAGFSGLQTLPGTRPRLAGTALVLLILAYDLRFKKSPAVGSLAMGSCRFLNLYLGTCVWAPYRLQPALVLGTYVAILTLVSTLEERSSGAERYVRWGLLGILPLDAGLVALYGRPLEAGIILLLLAPRLLPGRILAGD